MSSFEETMLENARKRRNLLQNGKVFGPKERQVPVYTSSISKMFTEDGKYISSNERSSSEE